MERQQSVGYSPFASCFVRKICPTTYDFPRTHWVDGQLDRSADSPLMRWSTGDAADVHNEIVDAFAAQALQLAGSRYFPRVGETLLELVQPSRGGHCLARIGTAGSHPLPTAEEFDVVILTTGVGTLRRRVGRRDGDESRAVPSSPHFVSYSYFDNDPILLPRKGVGQERHQDKALAAAASKKILLVGGGDGALVDFVRLTTGYADIAPVLRKLAFAGDQYEAVSRTADAMWKTLQDGLAVDRHATFHRFHKDADHLVDELWDDPAIRSRVAELIIPDPALRPAVQISFDCSHFGFVYPANRIAAELIARHLAENLEQRNQGLHPFRSAVRVVDVTSADPAHQCDGSAVGRSACARHAHQVEFQRHGCRGVDISKYVTAVLKKKIEPADRTSVSLDEAVRFDRVLVRTGAVSNAGLPEALATTLKNSVGGQGVVWAVPPRYLV